MSTEPLKPGARLGSYIIDEALAAGGFGRVFRATQTGYGGFERAVAIKVLRRSVQRKSGMLERFSREAQIVALLNHRNIVQIFEFAESEGLPYLVMELIEGVSLSELDQDGKGLPPWIAAGIGADVASALAYAHGLEYKKRGVKGVVHRDIKPSNILISVQGDVKVTDFGVAKMMDASVLQPITGVVGTPAYMSPENLEGKPATAKSDVFSLGLVILRLCHGSLPLRDTSIDEGKLREALRASPAVPEALKEILLDALEVAEKLRPTARELEQRLATCATELAPPRATLHDELAHFARSIERSSDDRAMQTATVGTMDGAIGGFAPQVMTATGRLAVAAHEGPTEATVAETPARKSTSSLHDAPTVLHGDDFSVTFDAPHKRRSAPLIIGITLTLLLAAGALAAFFLLRDQETTGKPARDSAPALRPDARIVDLSPPVDMQRVRITRPPDAAMKPDVKRKRPPPRPRPTIKPRGKGKLSVNARPWATVYVDGRKVGITPLFRQPVTAGRHTIRLVTTTGRRVVRRVTIKRGKVTNLGLITIR